MDKTNIRNHFSISRLAALLALLLLVMASQLGFTLAQTVTQGYQTDESLQRGMIVRLDRNDTSKIAAATLSDAAEIKGVVVNANDAPVTISGEDSKTFVATQGQFEVLVSDANGPIKTGDYITVSALTGIGAKSDGTEAMVVGKALASYEANGDVISTAEIKDSEGRTTKVGITRILADIDVTRNPLIQTREPNVPGFLQRAAESVADKPVNAPRIYMSIAVLLATMVVSASMLYAGIRSSIVAIGRNPLSRHSIIRSMLQVLVSSLLIFLVGVFGVYLLLKL